MSEQKYELHIWHRRWQPGTRAILADSGVGGCWPWYKVVLRYENWYQLSNQADCIQRDEWWFEDRLIPFRDVLRMEWREVSDDRE